MGLKQKISRTFLKDHIGEEAIFRHYFGDFQLGRSYNSVFRKDNKSSTGFYISENGSIIYNDLATSEKYDFVRFVMTLHNLNYYQALERIAADFKAFPGVLKGVAPKPSQPLTQLKKPKKATFKVVTRPFSKQDLQYWGQYYITDKELKQNDIFSVHSFQINDYTIYTETNQLRFAYLFKDDQNNGFFKIYTPNDKERKWLNNATLNMVTGLKSLNCTQKTLVITKSVKDYIVLKKFLPDVIALQNESKAAFSPKTIKILQKCFKNIIIWFDADDPGIEAAKYYTETYGFKAITTPNSAFVKFGVKDPSDMVKRFGLPTFTQYLQHLNLI